MLDPTEDARRVLTGLFNERKADREAMEKEYGQVWDTQELQRDFTVQGFLAPFISVTRKSDGAEGLMTFQHDPRFYFNFTENT
jgi:hypothetical protein